MCARRVGARLRGWEGARRREGGEAEPALPAGVAPVRLPDPALQLGAVLRGGAGGGLGRFDGEAAAAAVGARCSRHVWDGARASFSG